MGKERSMGNARVSGGGGGGGGTGNRGFRTNCLHHPRSRNNFTYFVYSATRVEVKPYSTSDHQAGLWDTGIA